MALDIVEALLFSKFELTEITNTAFDVRKGLVKNMFHTRVMTNVRTPKRT
jgi:hypothetical protein